MVDTLDIGVGALVTPIPPDNVVVVDTPVVPRVTVDTPASVDSAGVAMDPGALNGE